MMAWPRAVDSALKLAGPSPQPRIVPARSASDKANMRRYSSKDRPHGTMPSRVNMFGVESVLEGASARDRSPNGCYEAFSWNRQVSILLIERYGDSVKESGASCW